MTGNWTSIKLVCAQQKHIVHWLPRLILYLPAIIQCIHFNIILLEMCYILNLLLNSILVYYFISVCNVDFLHFANKIHYYYYNGITDN